MSRNLPKGVIPREEVERQGRIKNSCPNCGEDLRYKLKDGRTVTGGHFVPPSVGDEGFFHCVKAPTPSPAQPQREG